MFILWPQECFRCPPPLYLVPGFDIFPLSCCLRLSVRDVLTNIRCDQILSASAPTVWWNPGGVRLLPNLISAQMIWSSRRPISAPTFTVKCACTVECTEWTAGRPEKNKGAAPSIIHKVKEYGKSVGGGGGCSVNGVIWSWSVREVKASPLLFSSCFLRSIKMCDDDLHPDPKHTKTNCSPVYWLFSKSSIPENPKNVWRSFRPAHRDSRRWRSPIYCPAQSSVSVKVLLWFLHKYGCSVESCDTSVGTWGKRGRTCRTCTWYLRVSRTLQAPVTPSFH